LGIITKPGETNMKPGERYYYTQGAGNHDLILEIAEYISDDNIFINIIQVNRGSTKLGRSNYAWTNTIGNWVYLNGQDKPKE
jgi:hypothetical protein